VAIYFPVGKYTVVAPESIAAWIAAELSEYPLGSAPKETTFAQWARLASSNCGVSWIGRFNEEAVLENRLWTAPESYSIRLEPKKVLWLLLKTEAYPAEVTLLAYSVPLFSIAETDGDPPWSNAWSSVIRPSELWLHIAGTRLVEARPRIESTLLEL